MEKEILNDYESGLSIRDIAKKYNRGSSTIHRIIKKNNISRTLTESWEMRGSIKLNSSKICKSYKDGMSVLQLSKKFTCSRNKIQKILNDNNIEKYVDNEKIKNIRKETNIEKYGLPYYTNRDKAIETMKIRYGVEYPLQSPTLLNKIKETNLEKYGSKSSFQNKDVQNKYIKNSLEKYGVENPTQFHISKKSMEKLNNIEWLKNQHHIKKITLDEISKTLDVNQTTICNYFRKHNIEIKRFSVSSQERKLFDELSKYDIKILQNDRSIISPLELDLYFPDHNLAIEINGLYWHNEDHKDNTYHENKRLLCEEKGITLLQFWDYEINNNFDLIISMIKNYLKLNKLNRVYARKCKVIKINDKRFIKEFLNNNHIQGSTGTSICYGVEYENKILSIMCFNKSNLKEYDYNLVRFCSLKGYSVIGGASKLLKQMKDHIIVSYSDGRYSNGDLYKTLGFECIKTNKPDYKYTIDYITLYHKFLFRRKSIKLKFPEYYRVDLTEREMMYNIGFKRVYGCAIKTWKFKSYK